MDITSNLNQSVKIGDRGAQVSGTMNAAIFCHVYHRYMHINIIIGELINLKSVYLTRIRATKQDS